MVYLLGMSWFFRLSSQNAITYSAIPVCKELLKLVTASVLYVLQVLGPMMSNPFTSERDQGNCALCCSFMGLTPASFGGMWKVPTFGTLQVHVYCLS